MPKILKRLKRDLKKIQKTEEDDNAGEIIFKQDIKCGKEKHTNYYLLEPDRKG